MSDSLYPCELSKDAQILLKEAVDFAVSNLGRMSQSELEAEEMIAVASEKAPTDDQVIQKLRDAFVSIKREYESVTKAEHEQVTTSGGLHVIGTERHESRRVDNQLRGRCGRQGDLVPRAFSESRR